MMNSIGEAKAIELANSKWWENLTPREIVQFQLFSKELCMPFDVFHEALEKALDRSVWTHELAKPGILQSEFLGEEKI